MAPITWLSWSTEAFARAAAERKPVLLSIAAAWCRHCAEMDRTSYADPGVAAVIASRFVPVRVDADRRPDIGLRYGLGGWPTTAFLTPAGEILGGGTYVDAERLVQVLAAVHDAFAAGRHVRQAPGREPEESPRAAGSLEDLIAQVNAAFDPVHGGFGGAPKFPHTAPVRLAIEAHRRSGSPEAREIAVTSLDAMGWGPLYDEQRGGFFRYASRADWGGPNGEKLLDVNAALLALYVRAFEALELTRYAERAQDIVQYVQAWLANVVDGGWAASQRAGPPVAAGTETEEEEEAPAAPPVDRTVFADWNGTMISAALDAGRVLGDASLSEFAIRSLERVIVTCYRPGAGIAHYVDDAIQIAPSSSPARSDVRGLLDDQVAMGLASLDAFDATADISYEMLAEELALYALRTMWDDEGGGFFDRARAADDIGLLREPCKPFSANCSAARMLRRLGHVTRSKRASRKEEFERYADRTLAAMAGRAPAEGLLAAEYVLACLEPGE